MTVELADVGTCDCACDERVVALKAENERLTEGLSWVSGHDRSGLDHLAEAEAWRLAVEELRTEAETKEPSGRLVLLAFCDEVERRHHDIIGSQTTVTERTDSDG